MLVSTNTICTVVIVLGVLLLFNVLKEILILNLISLSNSLCSCAVFLLLLLLVCVLWLLFWRNRSKKTVTPGSQSDQSTGGSISSPALQSDGEKDEWNSEEGWRTFAGVRTVKSAHAALCTSPSGAVTAKESATVQSETRPRAEEHEGKLEKGVWCGVEIEMENESSIPDESTLDSAGIADDTLPYLSIGMNMGDADEQAADGPGQRATAGKPMKRISTWPPTAVEWQARRKREQEQEVRLGLDVWPLDVTVEEEKAQKCRRPLEKIEGVAQREDERKISDAQPDVRHSHMPKPADEGASVNDASAGVMRPKEETRGDLASVGQTSSEATSAAARGLARAAKAGKSARRNEAAAAEKRGVTPNDETLLFGNEYVFVDLLHEVVQNKGRWTRERWRQTHTCKPGRKQRGADTRLK